MKTVGIMILALILVGSVNASETSKKYDFEKTFTSGKKIDIDLKSGGSINIAGKEQSSVTVRARFRGEDCEDLTFDAEESNGTIHVNSRYMGGRHSYNASSDLEIEVPSRFDVSLRTMGGDVSINNVEGEISGETMGGELNLQSLKGNVQLTTMGGEIMLQDSNLDGSVKSMGGDVVIRNVSGGVKGSTMGGNVRYENADGAGKQNGEVKIHSMGGEINVDDAPEGASLETMGGDIHVRSASKFVEANTMGGNIDLDSIDGWVSAGTMGGDVKVRVIGNTSEGKRDIELTSMAGDIELTVPDGMSMDLDLEIQFDAERSRTPKIISDFPVKTWQEENRAHSEWGHSMTLHGTGQSGNGAHKVRIKTVQGDIVIRRG